MHVTGIEKALCRHSKVLFFKIMWSRLKDGPGKFGTLAGVPFSCISRVSPVHTIGVWSVRNLPPQSSLLSYS